jgi:peptidoglycan/xylan/chitin deacetylase (PgdA/CDA1 family)
MSSGTVCVTFDFDAASVWIAAGQRSAGPLSRGQFGVEAVPRILDLLRSRGIPSTWFIPGHTIESFPDACARVVEAGHEIGLHGYAHENVEQLEESEERDVLGRAYEIVESFTGIAPRGNRTPSWTFSGHTIDLLLERGLTYDSSLMAADYRPYYCRTIDRATSDAPLSFEGETMLVELPVTWSLDDFPALEFVRTQTGVMPGLKRPDEMFANWLDDIRYMQRDFVDGVCVLTLHPQVVGRGHRMLALERFLDQLGSEVEFARLTTIAESYLAGREYGRYEPAATLS